VWSLVTRLLKPQPVRLFTSGTHSGGLSSRSIYGSLPSLSRPEEAFKMSLELILVIVVVVFLLGGGGWFWQRGRG
jgi:hypothetical protein